MQSAIPRLCALQGRNDVFLLREPLFSNQFINSNDILPNDAPGTNVEVTSCMRSTRRSRRAEEPTNKGRQSAI